MLQIRPEQAKVFQDKAEAAFLDRLVAHVQKTFPAKALPLGPGVRARVKQGVDEARGNGFVTERQIASYVDLGFMVGPAFAQQPWARRVLREEDLDPGTRIRRLQVQARLNSGGKGS